MGTKNNPGDYDCYKNAEPDEPMFILLARDVSAPDLVRTWADRRAQLVAHGEKPESDLAVVYEARECADQMEDWRRANRELAEMKIFSANDIAQALTYNVMYVPCDCCEGGPFCAVCGVERPHNVPEDELECS